MRININCWDLVLKSSIKQPKSTLWVHPPSTNGTTSTLSTSQTSPSLFFTDLLPGIKSGVYPSATPKITSAVRTYADAFLSVVQEYTPTDGGLSEEYDRDTSVQVSVPDLTWPYAAILSNVAR